MLESGIFTADEFDSIAAETLPKGTIVELTYDVRGFFTFLKAQNIANAVDSFQENNKGILEVLNLDVTENLEEFSIRAKVITNPVVTLALIIRLVAVAAAVFLLFPTLQTVRLELPEAAESIIAGVGTVGDLIPVLVIGGVIFLALK